MKKLLIILLCLPFIGFGKTNSSHNELINTDAEDTWEIINHAPFLTSEFRSNCDEPINVESRVVSFRKKNIFLGVGGETGGTIMMIMYNSSKKLYKVIFAHDNDGYGDSSTHEFIFKYQLNKIVFPNEWWDTDFNEYSISNLTYHNCDFEPSSEDEIFMTVETMPEFPGGELGLMNYIRKNVKYPPIAKEYNITGKVYVSFIVDKSGSVTNEKIVRGVDKNLDTEALRVVKSMPKFKPGTQRGKAVRVMFTIPINFNLD